MAKKALIEKQQRKPKFKVRAYKRCPICGRNFDSEKSQSMPFCGERCRLIDLSRWLDEKYVLPIEQPDDDNHDESADDEE